METVAKLRRATIERITSVSKRAPFKVYTGVVVTIDGRIVKSFDDIDGNPNQRATEWIEREIKRAIAGDYFASLSGNDRDRLRSEYGHRDDYARWDSVAEYALCLAKKEIKNDEALSVK